MKVKLLFIVFICFHLECCAAQSCPKEWSQYGESCYLLVNQRYSWFDAKVACDTTGSQLVEIANDDENQFVANLLNSSRVSNAWLGLEDFVVGSEYRWSGSREVVEFTKWKPGEPNDKHGQEDCVEIDRNGGWNDAHCEKATFAFVCEAINIDNIIG